MPGVLPVGERPRGLVRVGPVVSHPLGLGFPGDRPGHQQFRHARMQRASPPTQHPVVGDLLQKRVPELEARARTLHGPQHLLGGELRDRRAEARAVEPAERSQQRAVELAPQHRRQVDQAGELAAGGRAAR